MPVNLEAVKEAFFANTIVYYILAASTVVLIAAGIVCDEKNECKDYDAWAVAAGAVSTGLTFFHAILSTVKPQTADRIGPFLSTFLVLWWVPGAFVPTFKTPFVTVGNGYFGCWVAFLSSLVFFQRTGLSLIAGAKEPANDAPSSAGI